MKAFRRKRPYSPDDVLTLHTRGGQSVQGAFVRRTRFEWVLKQHRVEVDGVYIESSTDRVCVPIANVAFVEVRDR